MDKWLYGYWFKSKRQTVGWGWAIIPNTLPGYVTWVTGAISSVFIIFPELISGVPKTEVMSVSGLVFAVVAFITFLKTNFV